MFTFALELKHKDMNSKQVNRDFRLLFVEPSTKTRVLIGFSRLISTLGEELAQRTIERAYKSKDDKITCKFRRGIQIIFYSK